MQMGKKSNCAAQIQAGKEVLLEQSRVSCRQLRIVSIIAKIMLSIYAFTIDFLFIVRDHPNTVVYGILFFVPVKRDGRYAISSEERRIKTFGEVCRL